ncbi:MAG TPA: serine/threonine-protein kinase [Euzebya sp.]|nr:serine/threonine-protein kinase [Euzebya sp.]
MHAIPGYGDLERIGAGASATVYRARQDGLGREVALKVLVTPTMDAKTGKRFARELQALGALGWHPNIVVLFDAGTSPSGAPYIAMEHLPGGSLADQIPLPARQVTRIGVKIAGALHCAHAAGVLHRDVKPANILLDQLGEVKLADFGISGRVDATQTTGGGMTLAHVAPEVVDGGIARVRSDVYSLASTMFELLSGRAPFVGEDPAAMAPLLMRILDSPVPDLRPAGVPPPLAAALEAAMVKDPDQRPRSAAVFGHLLQAVEHQLGWPVTELPLPPDRATPASTGGAGPVDGGAGDTIPMGNPGP